MDIHERKQAEAGLQLGEGLLQAFFENSPNLILVKDRQGHYVYANREFKKAFHTSGEINGKTDDELIWAEQAAAFLAVDRQVLQSGSPVKFQDVAHFEDGTHARILQKIPLFNTEGEIHAIGQDGDKFFESFYTIENDGMGIGPSVSRSVIESHNGRLWATLNDGPGAAFSFSIPRGPGGLTRTGTMCDIQTFDVAIAVRESCALVRSLPG